MKVFKYKDEWYTRIIPAKKLFNSTTIYEVVNRGDIFALNLETGIFTIISGKEKVDFIEAVVMDKKDLDSLNRQAQFNFAA